jgi:hypothetical protein
MSVGDHYRSDGEAIPAGVYRVVGEGAETVLLRVADGDGRRVHEGELHRVGADAADLDPAPDPNAGLDPAGAARDALQGAYWSVRRFFP